MTTLPATAPSPGPHPLPPAPCREFDDIVLRYRGRLEDAPRPGVSGRKEIRRDRMPAPHILDAIVARAGAIRASLVADPEMAFDVVSTLRAGWRTYGEDKETARKITRLYVRAVQDEPVWAVQAAAARFLQARTITPWKPRECPEVTEFALEVRAGKASVLGELVALEEIARAEPYDPPTEEDRARVAEMAAAFKSAADGASMARASAGPPPTSDAERQAAEAMLAERAAEVAAAGEHTPDQQSAA